MTDVSAGQMWELSAGAGRGRLRVRIESIDGDTARATVLTSGRAATFSVKTLSLGLRASRLVQNADGTAPGLPAEAAEMLRLKGEGASNAALAVRFGVSAARVAKMLILARREEAGER